VGFRFELFSTLPGRGFGVSSENRFSEDNGRRTRGVTCPVSKRPTVEARRVWFGLRVLLCLGQKRPTVEARSVMLCRLRREGKERVSERERASERARAREAEREGERGRGQG
jgi:hypothetical protein